MEVWRKGREEERGNGRKGERGDGGWSGVGGRPLSVVCCEQKSTETRRTSEASSTSSSVSTPTARASPATSLPFCSSAPLLLCSSAPPIPLPHSPYFISLSHSTLYSPPLLFRKCRSGQNGSFRNRPRSALYKPYPFRKGRSTGPQRAHIRTLTMIPKGACLQVRTAGLIPVFRDCSGESQGNRGR